MMPRDCPASMGKYSRSPFRNAAAYTSCAALRCARGGSTGAPEDTIHIGDRFSVGSAEVVVTQPRLRCYKLGVRFQMDDMVKRFLASRRSGFYLAVLREGEVGVGDEMKQLGRDRQAVPISEITRLYVEKRFSESDMRVLDRALQVQALPESWKEYFRERMGRAAADA